MIEGYRKKLYKITNIFEEQLDPSIDIWMLNVRLISRQELLNVEEYLSLEEIQRSNNFLFERDRNSYLARRKYLKIILSKYLLTHPRNIQINYSRYEKPFIKDFQIHLNISHSMTKSVIATHKKGPIGIDIEDIQTTQNISELLKYFASDLEQKWVNDSRKDFYLLWTIKEAILKYKGVGFLNKKLPELKHPPVSLTNTLFHTQYQKLNIYSKVLDQRIISVCF